MIYVSSRVHHAGLWRQLRAEGFPIASTWIDEAGEGETPDLETHWVKILEEIRHAKWFVLYVKPEDFPLKGAFVEAGMALALGKHVVVVAPGVQLEPCSMRPLGSWVCHPLVMLSSISLRETLRGTLQ